MPKPEEIPTPDQTFEKDLEELILSDLGIGVDDPQVGTDVVNSIAETLRSTPGTLSHYMAEAEEWEAAWGAMDDEEE
ncbi:MAG TPA: hypothetical protein VJY84_01965 [Candidatus Saccharimonadales bacterium]|nr:hypothetical protein [Candidatus Saccharimonadales bacterium]